MAPRRADAALLQRLETLTGDDGTACCVDLRGVAATLRPAAKAASLAHKALADENRLVVASLLKKHGSLCACELQAALGLTHATVSHHMAILVDAGIVLAEKRGKWMHYTLTPQTKDWVP